MFCVHDAASTSLSSSSNFGSRLAQSAALAERGVIKIILLDTQDGGDVVADEVEPRELVRCKCGSSFGLVHQPFVEAFLDGFGERLEYGLLLQGEADEGNYVGEPSGLRAALSVSIGSVRRWL